VPKPSWTDTAKSIVPFATAAAIVAGTAMLSHQPGGPAGVDTLLAEGAVALVANGLSAFCRLGDFWIHKEYKETLVNHDILRVIRGAWGDAAKAAIDAYVKKHSGALSILTGRPPKAFLIAVRRLKAHDFVGRDISVSTIRAAIETSRRSLLGTPDPQAALAGHLAQLQDALVHSVIGTVTSQLGSTEEIPADFRDYLAGKGGVLDQLVIHTAYYLKTDQRAQTAVLHFTLQEIADSEQEMLARQTRMEVLCQRIHDSQSASEKIVIRALEERLKVQNADLLAHLDRKLNDEHRPRLGPAFSPEHGAADFTYRFAYRLRATKFVGRKQAMKALMSFMGDPRPALWTVISGAAGNGKSRLAAELIEMAGTPDAPAGRWRAGFLRNAKDWLKSDAVKWERDADTLLVIDYASEIDRQDVSDFLAHLRGAGAVFSASQMRVILIDRLPPDGELGIAMQLTRGSDRSAEIAANRWRDGEGDPLTLKPVSETDGLAIARDAAGAAWTPHAAVRVEQALRADTELARPLFAYLLGDAIRSGKAQQGALNPVSVASSALARLFPHSNGNALGNVKTLLAAATACQGIAEDSLFAPNVLEDLIGGQCSYAEIMSLQHDLRTLTGSSDGRIHQLEPDFLGGLFVLEQLLALPKACWHEKSKLLMSLAWRHGSAPGAFLERLTSDFVGRENQVAEALHSSPQRVEELLEVLVLSGLTKDAL
jgi:hypothetical protein